MSGKLSFEHWKNRLSNKHWQSRVKACAELGHLLDFRGTDSLIRRLEDSSLQVRLAACAALGQLGDSRATASLIEQLEDQDSRMRLAACAALRVLGDAAAVEPLLQRLSDKNSDVREAAFAALEKDESRLAKALTGAMDGKPEAHQELACLAAEGDCRAVRPLIKCLADRDWKRRRAASMALGSLHAAEAIEPLIERLGDVNSNVCAAAHAALQLMGQTRMAGALVGALEGDEEACGELARLVSEGDSWPVDLMIRRLSDSTVRVRERACAILGKLGDRRATKFLIERLADANSDVRESACAALGELRDQLAVVALIETLSDRSRKLRRAACRALGKLNDSRAVEPLLQQLAEKDHDVCWAASTSLGELAHKGAVLPLIAQLGFGNAKLRHSTCVALGRLQDSRAIEPLLEQAGDSDPDVRHAACAALKQLGEVSLANVLMGVLEDRIDATHETARMAAEGDLRPVVPLLRWLKEGSWKLRRTAHTALNAIWRITESKLNGLICPVHLARFQKRKAGILIVTRVAYAACPICSRGWPVIAATKVVAVLDSASSPRQWKDGEVLRVNWLVHGMLFDFDGLAILQADDAEVKRFLGSLRSDWDLEQHCRQMLCTVMPSCRLSENTQRALERCFERVEFVI